MPFPVPSPQSAPQPPAGAQAPAGAAASGQPPIGSSPATQPVPNRGLQAAALAKLGVVIRQLEQILPAFGAGSEAGRDILKALSGLSKHVEPGSISSGVEMSALNEAQNKMRQNAAQMAAMKAAQPAGAGGEAPQGAPGGGAPGGIPPQMLQMLMQKPQGSA